MCSTVSTGYPHALVHYLNKIDYKLHAWEVKVVYYYMRVSTKLVPRAFNEDGTIVTVRHCR